MTDTKKVNESRLEALLQGGAGPQETATGGGLAPGVASASPNPSEVAFSMATSGVTGSAETDVSKGTKPTLHKFGEKDTILGRNNRGGKNGEETSLLEKLAASDKRTKDTFYSGLNQKDESNEKAKQTIKISNLSEEQLFTKLQEYISTMYQFASKTKNVHRELKETLSNTAKVFQQYSKIRSNKIINNSSASNEEMTTRNGSESSQNTTESLKTMQLELSKMQKNQDEYRQQLNMEITNMKKQTIDAVTDAISKLAQQGEDMQSSGAWKHRNKPRQHRNQDQPQRLQQHNNVHQQQQQLRSTEQCDEGQAKLERKDTPWTTVSRRTSRALKNQAVVISRHSDATSYADMVRKVKTAVREENLTYDIITRRAKSGNIILEIPKKEQADHVAEVLKMRMGETTGIRRPSPSIPLIFIGIEDSVDESELKCALVNLDDDLKSVSGFTIREGKNGTRTAIIRVPFKAGTKLIHAKRIKVGWAYCRIKEFDYREQACNKCREKGHLARDCTGPEMRKCFRCKEIGHVIANCKQPDDSAVQNTGPSGGLPTGGPSSL